MAKAVLAWVPARTGALSRGRYSLIRRTSRLRRLYLRGMVMRNPPEGLGTRHLAQRIS